MKKFLLTLSLLAGIFVFAPRVVAADYLIKNFDSTVNISQDSTVKIEEKIEAQFNAERHGIIRFIPVKYKDANGQNLNIRFNLISVKDEAGNNLAVSKSKSGNDVQLKIGDPNVLVSGNKTYDITYTVNRVINSFPDHDELYWNVTGNEWDTSIQNATVHIINPGDINPANIQKVGYVGGFGSVSQDLDIEDTKDGVIYKTREPLGIGEGLTAVYGIPKDIIQQPSAWQKFIWTMQDNFLYFLPIFTLIFMIYLLNIKGKDPIGRTTIAPEFDVPDNLTPSELALVESERVKNSDLSAEIVDLAVKGHIKILEPKKNDFTLEKLSGKAKISAVQQSLLDGIFGSKVTVRVKDISNLYSIIQSQKNSLYGQVTKDGYFAVNPFAVRVLYSVVGAIVGGIGFFIFASLGGNPSVLFGFIGSAIIIIIFAQFMPRKTDKGVETARKIKGLKLFIKTAEKYRIKFQEDERIFEKLLPYAMVLGVSKFWAKAFEGIYKQAPGWYAGYHTNNFLPLYFVASMNDSFANSLSAKMSPPASSGGSGFGGGGFSGGGFGGGGGSSW